MSRDPLKFDVNTISQIRPQYDFEENPGEGKFFVYTDFEKDHAFSVNFGAFMDWKLELDRVDNNGELFMWMMNNYRDKTISHAVYDLYDIGFAVDDWVKEYITYLIESRGSRMAAMFALIASLKDFGSGSDFTGSISDDDYPEF